MNFEVRFRVPDNLNIEEIIEKNAVAFYGNKLKKENLVFICASVVQSRTQHSGEITDKLEMDAEASPFTPMCSAYLKEVVQHYGRYLDYLVANGILLTDNHFVVGKKCRGYCFNSPYSGQRLKEITVKSHVLKKAIRRASERRNEEAKKATWGYSFLTKWWEKGKLEIDEGAAGLWIDEYLKTKIEKIIKNEVIIDKEWAINNAIDATGGFKNLIIAINSERHRYAFSGEGHRFYTPISNLKKELRGFITYNGETLVDVDIKNSQPFLAIAIFQSSFWESEKGIESPILALEGISKEMYKKVKENKNYKYIITLLKTSESLVHKESPFKKFIDLVVSGEFYEYIQKHFEPLYPTTFDTRAKVKVQVLTIFYIENYQAVHHKPSQTFKEHFPEVYKLFRLIKEIQHNYLPIILQRIESFLVIDVVCRSLSKQHPEIPPFTIHDNILTTKGNEGIVRDIMSSEIKKWIGYEPSLGLGVPEAWKTIADFEGYEVSSAGNVRGIERKVPHSTWERTVKPKLLKSRVNNRGYKDVRLSKEGKTFTKLVHVLSAEAFVPNPEGKPEVNHLDGDKLNNHYLNFGWATHSENIAHAHSTGLIKKKTTPVIDICTGMEFPSIKKAAEFNNLKYSTCKNQLSGKRKNSTCLRYLSSSAA